jgi:GMC oxidoreductase
MINSFLPLALATGNLTVFAECEAQTIAGEKRAGNFKATGLDVAMRDFASGRATRRARIKARAFALAAGAFFSENVYVADSSLFPTASGINPSWTIMALSHRVSSQLAKSLG